MGGRLVEPVKPKLRGWLHAAMVSASVSAGIVLVCLARAQQAALPCTVYSVTAWLLFGTSAVYHLGTWGPMGQAVLRRLDHANIFLITAGTCTPLAALLLPPDRLTLLLWIVWTGALTGIAFRVLWVNAHRWLYTPCYLALGWAPVRYLPDFLHTGGAAVVTPDSDRRSPLQHGRGGLRRPAPRPLAPLVRLPRGVSRLDCGTVLSPHSRPDQRLGLCGGMPGGEALARG